MGHYYELAVNGLVIETSKNFVPTYLTELFCESATPPLRSNRQKRGTFVLKASAKTIARRLDLLGYTLHSSRRDFEEHYGALEEWEREQVPEELTLPNGFDTWCALVSAAMEYVKPFKANAHLRYDKIQALQDERMRFIFGESQCFPTNFFLGFPTGSLPALRAIAGLVRGDTLVTLDLTDLAQGGWLEEEDLSPAEPTERLIVLTEGKSDSRFLQQSLEVVFPQFSSYLSFIDFETANAKGGTDELIQFVRMFIGCGIRNRIVVLFDNDAAGHEALQRLLIAKLPEHVFVMTLPPLKIAQKYPTLGPDGARVADVNGRACAIEMYFGRDILAEADGRLSPVRWGGFNEKLQRYQGHLANKGNVQKRFEDKLLRARKDPGLIAQMDFSGIRAIFVAIFDAIARQP